MKVDAEVLARRKDALEEKADRLSDDLGIIDPEKLKPDPDIRRHLDPQPGIGVQVTNPQVGFTYCWVNPWGGGRYIAKKQYQGWSIVSGDDPESVEHKDVSGHRKVGDVILMRIRTERKEELDYKEAAKLLRLNESAGRIEQFKRQRGIILHDGVDALNKMGKKEFAQQLAAHELERRIRSGTVGRG